VDRCAYLLKNLSITGEGESGRRWPSELLRKVPPPTGHAAVRKYGWRELRQWHRNDTACFQLWSGRDGFTVKFSRYAWDPL